MEMEGADAQQVVPDNANPMAGFGDAVRGAVSGVDRDQQKEFTASEKALAKRWLADVKSAKNYHKDSFERMRKDMDFVYKFGIGKQWDNQLKDDERYIANFIQRHVTSRVSALYAKNPKAVWRRRQRMDFAIWDGEETSVENALHDLQSSTQMGMPANPQTIALLEDISRGISERRLIEKVGRTLEILFNYEVQEQEPNFKAQMKQMVRRAVVCGVAFVRLGYQRQMERKLENQTRLADSMSQLKHLEKLRDDMMDGKFEEDDAEMEDLKVTIAALQNDDLVIREGLTFDFPKSDAVIVDKKCTQLMGWVGCGWMAEEFYIPPSEVQEIWKVDVGTSFTRYDYDSKNSKPRATSDYENNDTRDKGLCCIYKVYDKRSGTCFVIMDGYPGFIQEPYAHDVKVDSFFPYEALAFNQIEHPTELYSPSDVTLLRPQQKEYNRTREAIRQHRIANRPLYVTPAGSFEDNDQVNLTSYAAHSVIELDGMKEGSDIGKMLQPVAKVPIDPNVYETNQIFTDVERVAGSQEANIGGTSGASATEVSVGETSRLSTLESNTDDLNELLMRMAKFGGQILQRNMPKEQVVEIVGRGAVWPVLTIEQIVKEVWLEVEAGSSGRPNKAQDLANLERVMPFMLQTPGIRPSWIAKLQLRTLDDRFDIDEALAEGVMSITAMNGMKQIGTGDPATDPNAQGANGANNAPVAGATAPGPQPAFPVTQPAAPGPAASGP